ncbi:hypothetical protein GCM10027517_02180 [Phycicoccus ginsengisoli]
MRASYAVRAIGVVTLPAIALPLAAASASAAGARIPAPPSKSLPSGLDLAEPYVGQSTCDPVAKPYVIAFGELLKSHYAPVTRTTYGIGRNCNSGVTEHSEGRALDWMVSVNDPVQKAVADSVTQWLSAPDAQGRPGAMARRFGIMYIIWNHKMWRAYAPERGWAPYTGSVPHTDHIHFSFSWDGAYGRTSWWTGKPLAVVGGRPGTPLPTTPPAPPSATYTVLVQGASGSDVVLVQKVLGVAADGAFGPRTLAALLAWQKAQKLPPTGQLDAATWARMIALRLVPARPLASAPPQAPSPAPTPVPAPVVPKPPTTPATAVTSALAAYTGTTLRRGSSGAAVAALQRALAVPADGAFGPQTEGAVKAFQARRNLPANGVCGPATWAALVGQGRSSGSGPTAPPVTTSATVPNSGTGSAGAAGTVSRDATRTATEYTALITTVLRSGSRGAAVKSLQRALGGVAVDGAYGPRTVAAVQAFQRGQRLPVTGVTDAKVWRALERRDHPLTAYYDTVLRAGSRGTAVTVLQRALRVTPDGAFGPQTAAAVKALQGRARLARTGTVATLTWKALEGELRRR